MSINLAVPVSTAAEQQETKAPERVLGTLDLFKFKFPKERGKTGPITTGCILSMMDGERPVIHSYTNGEQVQTMAFVRGLPIPFNLFVLCLCVRMAPKRINGQIPTRVSVNGTISLTNSEYDDLMDLWHGVDLSAEIRDATRTGDFAGVFEPTKLAKGFVFNMLSDALTGDEESNMAAYCDLIRKIDEDYAASLIDPLKV